MSEQVKQAVLERDTTQHMRRGSVSLHVLDLTPFAPPRTDIKKSAPRGLAYLSHLLSHRIHLRDLRVRRVSTHHLDWRDFPPQYSTGLRHASWVTLRRFLNEHPLADLTVVTVLHIALLIAWRMIVGPARNAMHRPAAVAAPVITKRPKHIIRVMKPARSTAAFSLPRFSLPKFTFELVMPLGWMKSTAGIVAAAALFILPIGAYAMLGGLRSEKDRIMEDGMRAVGMLKAAAAAADGRDFASASQALAGAAQDFAAARERMGMLGSIMNAASVALPINATVTSPAPLLEAGEEASLGGSELAAALAAVNATSEPIGKFRVVREAASRALPHLRLASAAVSRVHEGVVPEANRDELALAKRELPRLTSALTSLVDAADAVEMLLGASGERRYLVLFQNNSELRPTGGFIGSFALVDVKNGVISAMEVPGGGSYDLQGSLSLNLAAPQPLRLINPKWEFQDANWYPDFPTSAAQLSRFYEKSGGPTVDGVIAVNATFVEKLLESTGPIDLPDYGKTISAQNFFFETQKQVELEYDKSENKPKAFIGDLAPKMIERLTSADEKMALSLAGAISEGLKEKELQFWFRDTSLQSRLSDFGLDGSIKKTDGDYLAVVHTNIAGQKTDLVMQEEISHSAKLMADGSVVVTLGISRTHNGQKGALFSGVRNVDYLRVYVPEGAELVEARGFAAPEPKLFDLAAAGAESDPTIADQERNGRTDRESGTRIFSEHGKTVFANWVQTDPGETSIITLTYRLPAGSVAVTSDNGLDALYSRVTGQEKTGLRYSLTVQRQSGTKPGKFTSTVDLPRDFVTTSMEPARSGDSHGRLKFEKELRSDMFFNLTAERL